MIWFALWAVLLLGAAAVFFLLGRDLWSKAKTLTGELSTATDRLTEITERLSDLDPATREQPPDVRSQGSSRPLQR